MAGNVGWSSGGRSPTSSASLSQLSKSMRAAMSRRWRAGSCSSCIGPVTKFDPDPAPPNCGAARAGRKSRRRAADACKAHLFQGARGVFRGRASSSPKHPNQVKRYQSQRNNRVGGNISRPAQRGPDGRSNDDAESRDPDPTHTPPIVGQIGAPQFGVLVAAYRTGLEVRRPKSQKRRAAGNFRPMRFRCQMAAQAFGAHFL
jgi:hypothetical protein